MSASPPQARRYDSGTTTFNPEGRLFQVEYAIAAIENAAAAVAVLCDDGIVVVGEKKAGTKLLAPARGAEKLSSIDEHVAVAVAGLTSDADVLVEFARTVAQRHRFTYNEAQPIEQLVQLVADYKHSYTQRGGLRPFGVSFLWAGWDYHRGWQLYLSDPSGNYARWKAAAIGANSTSAKSTLTEEYDDVHTMEQAQRLALKTLMKAMDTTAPKADQVEVVTMYRNEASGDIIQAVVDSESVDAILAELTAEIAPAGDV